MKKQRLVLISTREEIGVMYYKDLVTLFGDSLELFHYSLEKYKSLDASYFQNVDILLLTSYENFALLRECIPLSCSVINLQYTFLKENIEQLKALPKNTNALVCFHFYMVSTRTVAVLYEMGLKNLNLVPYHPDDIALAAKHYDLAIVGDNSANVPKNITKIISLGLRKLSLSTLIAVADAADIMDERLEETFYAYCQNAYTQDSYFLRFYDAFATNKIQLKTIMNCIDYAILIFDEDRRILDFNDNVKSMFCIRQNITLKSLDELPPFTEIVEVIKNNLVVKNRLTEIAGGKSILVSKERIRALDSGKPIYILLMKDVTKIQSLESSFRKQLAQKGHVTKYSFGDIYGKSRAISDCISKAKIIAKIDKPTLITGESGTGKELFAQSIHTASARKSFPFLALNCAALPTALLESELFGYTEGSFTGAKRGGHAGIFEMANNGSLFLDEISEISLETQAKLLRVLEEKEIMRIGSGEIISVNVRVIAATNQNLREQVRLGRFRMDLYYRLNTLVLTIPPIRERREDIPLLIKHILDSERLSSVKIDPQIMEFLTDFPWDGNVRELRNCIEYMAHICNGEMKMIHLPEYILEEAREKPNIETYSALEGLESIDRALAVSTLAQIETTSQGRRALHLFLKENYPDLSEYRLRNILGFLCEKGLTVAGKGRGGMKLTARGRAVLAQEEN